MRLRTKRNPLFFAKRHRGMSTRNSMILDALPKKNSWILDVGSNTGETSNFLADNSHVVIGLEKMEAEHRIALASAHDRAGFLRADVTADFITNGVDWDAILLLSVLHRIYAFEGAQQMRSVLSACAEKTRVLFIEGSTRHARYMDQGRDAPEFEDLNVESAREWHRALFDQVLGSEWSIDSETVLECSEAEPFRILYRLSKG